MAGQNRKKAYNMSSVPMTPMMQLPIDGVLSIENSSCNAFVVFSILSLDKIKLNTTFRAMTVIIRI